MPTRTLDRPARTQERSGATHSERRSTSPCLDVESTRLEPCAKPKQRASIGSRWLATVWIVATGAHGCISTDQALSADRLAPGMWVEAQGKHIVDGTPVVDDIEELERGSSDSSDKFELVAAAETTLVEGRIRLLGRDYELGDSTEFENAEREPVEPFPVSPGDWLKVKVRVKDTGARLRTIRSIAPREGFTIEGELSEIDTVLGRARIGDVLVQLNAQAKLVSIASRLTADPLSSFLADDQKSVPLTLRISDVLWAGGQLAGNYEYEDDYNLNATRKRDRSKAAASGKIDLLWLLGDLGYAFFEAQANLEERFRQNDVDRTDHSASVSRAYASIRLHDAVRLQVGRQDFDDEREWLFDEILDAARLQSRFGDFELDGAIAFGRDVLEEDDSTAGRKLWFGEARHWLDADHHLSTYVLRQSDSSLDDFEPYHLGMRSIDQPRYGFGHWAELSYALGHAGTKDIDGHAFDVGFNYRFDATLRPYVAAGFAFGSGRSDTDPEFGFRQTGFQDNNGKFGGLTSFRYYGEIVDPELANLQVLTLDFGLRPTRDTSIDLLFNSYRQDEKATVFGTDLRASPNGSSRDIGWEVDLVFGYRMGQRLKLELVGARFEPGAAFDQRDPAYSLDATFRLSF